MADKYEQALRVLGLEPGATEQAIKDAYRDLIKVWHPDRFASDPRLQTRAQDKLREVNAAFEQLRGYSASASTSAREPARAAHAGGGVREDDAPKAATADAKSRSARNRLMMVVSATLVGFVGVILFMSDRASRQISPADEHTQSPAPAAPRRVPPPRPAKREPEQPTPDTGSLIVASRPLGARVTFDGRIVGETPITVTDITSGEHRIEMALDGGSYQPWSSSVVVSAGQEEKLLAVLIPAEHAR